MNRNSYLDAADAFLPAPAYQLVTGLALIGTLVPLVAFGAWRYAIAELDRIDEGVLTADHRRSIDHARALAKIATLFYFFLLVSLGFRACL